MLALPSWQRAQAGLHLVMQYPTEVPGVHSSMSCITPSRRGDGRRRTSTPGCDAEAARIGFDAALFQRALNVDLSGGEKKRNETLQVAMLEPKIVILDELDSGLDIDALRDCALRIEALTNEQNIGVLAITHYNRLLEVLRPDHVHILVKGRIVSSGGRRAGRPVGDRRVRSLRRCRRRAVQRPARRPFRVGHSAQMSL